INDCMVLSALQSTELALECGLRNDQIIISCKTSRPRDLITVYRDLSARTEQPLHLGLTEAGMGMKGQIWSAASLGVLLYDGSGAGRWNRASRAPSARRTGARARAPVSVEGKNDVTVQGTYDERAAAFGARLDNYITTAYAGETSEGPPALAPDKATPAARWP